MADEKPAAEAAEEDKPAPKKAPAKKKVDVAALRKALLDGCEKSGGVYVSVKREQLIEALK